MIPSNMDFLEEFFQIVNALRNAMMKKKGQDSISIESIHWVQNLRDSFPEKAHIFDWFPKHYFQRSNRDNLEFLCNVKFTGSSLLRQLVIRKDSKILKQHYSAFKNLNKPAIKLPAISNPIVEAKIVIDKSDINADRPDDLQIASEPSQDQSNTEKRRCFGKFDIDILDLFTQPIHATLYKGRRFELSPNAEAIYTGDESSPYEVHSKKCAGYLSDDANFTKTQCIDCAKAWQSLWRVRKLNREKISNLQLIMSPGSKAYLDRDVDITKIDVLKLTRSSLDILTWNLIKDYQERNQLSRMSNFVLSDNSISRVIMKSESNDSNDDDDDDDFSPDSDSDSSSDGNSESPVCDYKIGNIIDHMDTVDTETNDGNLFNNDISGIFFDESFLDIDTNANLECEISGNTDNCSNLEDDFYENIDINAISWIELPVVKKKGNEGDLNDPVIRVVVIDDDDVIFMKEVRNIVHNSHTSLLQNDQKEFVDISNFVASRYIINDISTKSENMVAEEKNIDYSDNIQTRSDYKKSGEKIQSNIESYEFALIEQFESIVAVARDIKDFIIVHEKNCSEIDTFSELSLIADVMTRLTMCIKGHEPNSPLGTYTLKTCNRLQIKLGKSLYTLVMAEMRLASYKTCSNMARGNQMENQFSSKALLEMSKVRNSLMYNEQLKGGTYHDIFKFEDHCTAIDETKITQEVKMNGHTLNLSGFNTQLSMSSLYKTASQETDQQILNSVVCTHYSVAMCLPLHQKKVLQQVLCGFFTGTLNTAAVIKQTFTAELVSSWTGLLNVVVIKDAASINQGAQSALCTNYQYYKHPGDRLNGDIQRKVSYRHIIYDTLTHDIPDPTHLIKNERNNVSYSQAGGTKFLLLKDADFIDGQYVNNYYNIDDEVYTDDTDGRIRFADRVYKKYGYVLVDWDICFQRPFLKWQAKVGRLSVARGLTPEIFNAVKTNKMNAGFAIKSFSEKMALVEKEICDDIISSSAGLLSMEEEVIVRGIKIFAPFKQHVNIWWDVVNGKNVEGSRKSLGKDIVRERITYLNKDKLLIMRQHARMMDKMVQDVRDLMNLERLNNEKKAIQKRDAEMMNRDSNTDTTINHNRPTKKQKKTPPKVQESVFSVFRNTFTYKTHQMTCDTSYSMAGFIDWYDYHRPGISVDCKVISNDPVEGHFGSTKHYCHGDTGQDKIIMTESRGSQFRIEEGKAYIERGFKHRRMKHRNKSIASRIYVHGNCEADNDQGENEIETKYINRTHSVKSNDMSNLTNLYASNNARIYKDINLFQKK